MQPLTVLLLPPPLLLLLLLLLLPPPLLLLLLMDLLLPSRPQLKQHNSNTSAPCRASLSEYVINLSSQ
jgi:hypothetical protein